jgi:hypothetical protein
MDNLPHFVSANELSSWRKWAETSPTKSKQQTPSNLATGLTRGNWEQIPTHVKKSPYQSCGSCRRI